jgi:hypothetical protein
MKIPKFNFFYTPLEKLSYTNYFINLTKVNFLTFFIEKEISLNSETLFQIMV